MPAACFQFHEAVLKPLLKEPFKPRVLLLPRGTLGCQAAVKWAVKHGYTLSVKSGGHSPVRCLPCLGCHAQHMCCRLSM